MITHAGMLPLALKFLQVLCATKRPNTSLHFDAVGSKQVSELLRKGTFVRCVHCASRHILRQASGRTCVRSLLVYLAPFGGSVVLLGGGLMSRPFFVHCCVCVHPGLGVQVVDPQRRHPLPLSAEEQRCCWFVRAMLCVRTLVCMQQEAPSAIVWCWVAGQRIRPPVL